jgi:hypothetical protein
MLKNLKYKNAEFVYKKKSKRLDLATTLDPTIIFIILIIIYNLFGKFIYFVIYSKKIMAFFP